MSTIPAKSFRFKQFLVHQDRCAMRVNTDGCLLAAWANPLGKRILDVGCGSGVISLMIAQRNQTATIHSLDIDEGSCADSQINFQASPWPDRLSVSCSDFLEWSSSEPFDLIISNPPFFSNGVKPSDPNRRYTRHTEALPANRFLEKAASLLTSSGRISVIVPTNEFRLWEHCANEYGLKTGRMCSVCPDANKPAHRIMAEFGNGVNITKESLAIRNSNQEYSNDFMLLLQDFYLHF